MTRIRYAVLLVLASILGAGFASGATAYATPTLTTTVPADDPTTTGKLLLLLDASGSMNEKDPSGLTKIAAAKKALVSVVDDLPDTAHVGLRVYGATQNGGKPTPAACADTQLVHPITALDKPGLTTAINRFQAKGETPIAHSIDEAVKDLGATGKRNIVLVSDGQESCVPDPCPSIRAAVGSGVDLQIDTVGFGVNATARRQLQCIADAGHGSYYDASDAGQLTTSLNKLSQRAARSFAVTGKPVTGTANPDTAPTLTPNQYVDTLTTGPSRWYSLARAPGSRLYIAVTGRRSNDTTDPKAERISLTAQTAGGTSCGRDSNTTLASSTGETTLSATLSIVDDDTACGTAPTVLLSVAREWGSADAQPVELLYLEEPPVTNKSNLPPAEDESDLKPVIVPVAATSSPVVGGGSFSDAPTMTSGTYTDSLLPGEQVFYKVRVGWGQRAAMTVDTPTPGTELNLRQSGYLGFAVNQWNPARVQITHIVGEPAARIRVFADAPRGVVGEWTPTIRYENRLSRGSLALRQQSLAGTFTFAVSRDNTTGAGLTQGGGTAGAVPIRIRLAVEGTPSGIPTYAAGTSPTTSSPASPTSPSQTGQATRRSAGEQSGPRWGTIVGGGLAVLLALGGARYVLVRRRRSGGAP